MPKQQRRKPPKRKAPQAKPVDDDLLELAAVLDEHRLETNAEGWFTLPWHDGLNAAMLALNNGSRIVDLLASEKKNPWRDEDKIRSLILSKMRTTESYWLADKLQEGLSCPTRNYGFSAALRCFQLWLSDSHGGGHVYNTVLDWIRPTVTEAEVIEWRCRDAIGVSAQMARDNGDNVRRAFVLAWKRGLFHAAYALPRVRI